MSAICWITKGPELKVSAGRFIKELDNLGAHVEHRVFPGVEGVDANWVSAAFSPKTRYLFLSGFAAQELAVLTQKIRATVPADHSPFAICFIKDKNAGEKLADILSSGVDEIFSTQEKAKTVFDRLQLRLLQVESKLRLEKLVHEQSSKNAKNETILNQREEFLSVCAHDLRSPLGLIQSSLSMLLNSSSESLNDLQRELIVRARRQAGEAINLVNDLLDVMSFEQGLKPHYQLFALDSLLKPFHKDYQFQAEQKGVKLHYDNPVADWRVLADPDRIRQLMQNLVVNAMKFTERGKNIYLSVMPFQGKRKADPAYQMLVVSIKDEGKGMPQKELQKIFDRFTQIKDQSRSEGRGLGLTVAKQISTLHDGNIWVQSVEGEGSTFFVLFPHVISQAKGLVSNPSKKLKKILVIEPSTQNRERYYEILRRWGYDVVFGNDGIEAVTLAFHHAPELIVLSEGLAKMDESHVADTLRSDLSTSKMMLFLAGESSAKFEASDEEFAFDSFLKLPFTRETFQIALDRSQKKLPTKKKAA